MRQWWDDIVWAVRMLRARRLRRQMLFSERIAFDAALPTRFKDQAMIAYPDAFYHVSRGDMARAVANYKSSLALLRT